MGDRLMHGGRAAYTKHVNLRQEPCFACRLWNQRRTLARSEAEDEQGAMLYELIDLIAGECRRVGMLP